MFICVTKKYLLHKGNIPNLNLSFMIWTKLNGSVISMNSINLANFVDNRSIIRSTLIKIKTLEICKNNRKS